MSGSDPPSGLSPGHGDGSRRSGSQSSAFEMTSRQRGQSGSGAMHLQLPSQNPYANQQSNYDQPHTPENPPNLRTYWEQPFDSQRTHMETSPIDPAALSFALPPDINQLAPNSPRGAAGPLSPYDQQSFYHESPPATGGLDEPDNIPLTSRAELPAGATSLTPRRGSETPGRNSFQTISDVDGSPGRGRNTRSLGDDLDMADVNRASYRSTLTPDGNRRSRSPTTSEAFFRASSMMRAMSQRIVNISGENELPHHRPSLRRSQSSTDEARHQSVPPLPMDVDTSYRSQTRPYSGEKSGHSSYVAAHETEVPLPRRPMANPLKGKSLGLFSPENPIRKRLCDMLVHPFMEPFILVLIIVQTVILTIESAPDVFSEGYERPERFGSGTRPWIDWTLLVLFVIFTLELTARIIVSGLILNASEYSTFNRKEGVRAAVTNQYRAVFNPQRQKSVKADRQIHLGPSALARSITFMQGQTLPETEEEHSRYQLARRAFLRHSFNRLDFLAVTSYWISFLLSVTGLEHEHSLYIFRMLSCLRILRLLALTSGTAIILRSLKKAAPLLVRIAFLILFFWLLFAIIGLQSFKASLSRQCVWLDPDDPTNRDATFVNDDQLCGGYINETNGNIEPWVFTEEDEDLTESNLQPGALGGKGFICPRGSLCLQGENPAGGTVSFDDIFSAFIQVFVIMSSNGHTEIMYNLANSDYLATALYYAAGMIILTLWLINLLIAVITSSFQIIREESRGSAFTSDAEPAIRLPDDGPIRKPSLIQKIYDKTHLLWIGIIALGLIVQCLRSASMSDSREMFIDNTEVIVTILLDIEIVIRFVADWRGFHRSRRNLFDLFLAITTSIILIPPIRNSGRVYAWLTIFQIVRIYRVVLAVPMTGKLVRQVVGSSAGIGNLILFVSIIAWIMALLACQLFRGLISNEKNVAFRNVYNAFLGIWQVLSSEDWTDILYEVTETFSEFGTAWIGAGFWIGWFILAYFILVNMFIAVIQENFDVSEDEKRMEQVKAFLQKKELGQSLSNLALSNIFTFGRSRKKKDPLDYGPATMEMLLKDAVVQDFLDDPDENTETENGNSQQPIPPKAHTRAQTLAVGEVQPGFLSNWWGKLVNKFSGKDPNPFYSNNGFDNKTENLDPRQMARQVVNATAARRKAQREYLARHPNYNNSLFVFTPKNPIRVACQRLVGPGRGSERFDGVEPNKIAWYTFSIFIYAAIVAMVVIACVTTPLYQKLYKEEHGDFSLSFWYVWTDSAFALIFFVEAVVKVIADGFFFTPNAYYRSSWGIIDGVVLVTLLINVGSVIAQDGDVTRAIGAFKALRALRLLNVSDSARDTFHSLIIVGWWKILSAAFVSISLLIPFAIYGLNLWNGVMISCNDDDDEIVRLSQCYGEFESEGFNEDWPMLAPRVAANDYFNFDNFGNSIFILFSILSQEGWVDVSFASQAVTGKGLQPQDLENPGNAMFFVIYNLLGTVFVLALFIAVFMRNYTEQTGVAFLTAEQRSWMELRKLLQHISPSKTSYNDSEKTWKRWCHKRAIEKRGKWYQTVTGVLVFQILLLVVEYRGEPQAWARARDFLFLGCVLVYMANVQIRLFGLGWTRFRRSSWDMYSLPVVAGAFISTAAVIIVRAVENGVLLEGETYVQVHKSFLVAVVLLIIPRNDALDQLFKTAAASLTTIGNLLATWLVLFLIFAIALTQAFSLTRFGDEENNNVNFRSVPQALVLLFRMSWGEGWNIVMEDFANIEPPLCVADEDFFDSDCGSKPWARFLFSAWNLLSMYIFVNLFISLIYESFSYVYQRSSGIAAVDRDEIRRFKEAWRSVDPDGTGWISKDAFPRLLGELSGVFEMRIYDADDSVSRILEDVRSMGPSDRHASVATSSGPYQGAYTGIDLQRLNQRINQLDVVKIRERRKRFNIFFEEVMVSADSDKGIAFDQVLMILAHYNIINDSKSLKLEEYLRRRARLQRVDEEVRRRVVLGFFDTLYYSRLFKKHMEHKRSARMTDIPQLDIPHIFVDEDEENSTRQQPPPESPISPRDSGKGKSTMLSAADATNARGRSWSGSSDISTRGNEGSWQHPLAAPRSGPSSPSHHSANSAFSFELQRRGSGSPDNSRPGSTAVSPSASNVRNMLDDSVWVESIRRSATQKKADYSKYR